MSSPTEVRLLTAKRLSPNQAAVVIEEALLEHAEKKDLEVIDVVGPLMDRPGTLIVLQTGGEHLIVTVRRAELVEGGEQ